MEPSVQSALKKQQTSHVSSERTILVNGKFKTTNKQGKKTFPTFDQYRYRKPHAKAYVVPQELYFPSCTPKLKK